MSRRKTRPEEIRNPEHYFNRYIAKEMLKDQEKQAEYDNFFCSLEEKLEKDGGKGQRLVAVNTSGYDLEGLMAASSLFAWIDYVENPKLHQAVHQMTDNEKKLLTYRFHYCFTQRETAEIMGMTQVAVHRCERKLLKHLRAILSK